MIPAPAPDSAPYTILYRSDLDLAVLRWQRENTFPELKASYAELLALAQHHGCARWLLDGRREGAISRPVTVWLTTVFFPDAVAALAPRPLRLGVFTSPARLTQMHADAAVAEEVRHALASGQPYQAGVFIDEGEALRWLTVLPQ